MTTIMDVWEAHRHELCQKIIELGKMHIVNLVMALEKHQLIHQNMTDIVIEMSEQDAGELSTIGWERDCQYSNCTQPLPQHHQDIWCAAIS